MKRILPALGLAVVLVGLGACKKQTNDNDAIRVGILQHLTSIGTLNMSAMDMDMRSVSVRGNQAHAEVEFRVKTGGAPVGAGMQVAYDLEKRGSVWVVLKTQPLGGMQHPATSQNSGANQPVHSMPNFNELLNPSSAAAQRALPPGHPPLSSSPAVLPSAPQAPPSTTKPQ
ncbi:MAG TPA: hypothetical protein VJN92_21835 [Candidatus Acidoferrum sp.]|nr:hypothetical protein [Candidatus Acidoferrum sp.]